MDILANQNTNSEFYVWHIQSGEFMRVETPTYVPVRPFYVYGTKVIFRHNYHLYYWSFESRVLHEINCEYDDARDRYFGDDQTLIANPSKGDIAMIFTNETYRNSSFYGPVRGFFPRRKEEDETPENIFTSTVHFEADENFGKVVQRGKLRRISYESKKNRPINLQYAYNIPCALNTGQIPLALRTEVRQDSRGENSSKQEDPHAEECCSNCGRFPYKFCDTFLTLEDDEDVVIHRLSLGNLKGFPHGRRSLISPGPGVIYVAGMFRNHYHRDKITIMHTDDLMSRGRIAGDALIRNYSPYKPIQGPEHFRLWGDQDFMVAINSYGIVIGSFNPLSTYDLRKVNWSDGFNAEKIPGGSWQSDSNLHEREDEELEEEDSAYERWWWSHDGDYETSSSEPEEESHSEEGSNMEEEISDGN